MASVGILGAGIAGLTAAYQLQQQGVDVTVFEATAQPGGRIRSEHVDGYLLEHGPNTIQRATPLMNQLIDDLDLAEAVVETDAAAKKRYVVRNGRPTPLPTSPLQFLRTDLFSTRAKLRLLAEPFIRPADPDAAESVADFARRRLGSEMLDYGLNPFVGGIFAGAPEQLSLQHAFARLYALEQEHGSLFKGLIHALWDRDASGADASEDEPQRRMFSFRDGLQMLPLALAHALDEAVRYEMPVVALQRNGTRWQLTAQPKHAPAESHRFDALLSTLPLYRLAALDTPSGLDFSPLAAVAYPPVSVIAMGFARANVAHPLDGFGLLVPEVEVDYQILGTIFTSSLFPDRAPDDHVLLTTFVGGARRPELARTSIEAQQARAEADLRTLLGTQAHPSFVRTIRWPHAIPQYTLGYEAVTAHLDRLEAEHSRLFLAGNYRNGIAVSDAMASGAKAAQRCVRALSPEIPTAM